MFKFRDNLYIGGFVDASNETAIQEAAVTAILNVAFELSNPIYHPLGTRNLKIGLMDNDQNPAYMKRLAIDTLKKLIEEGETVLVHCAMGMSRSVYVLCKAVAELEGKTVHEVFAELTTARPNPTPTWGGLFEKEYIPIGADETS